MQVTEEILKEIAHLARLEIKEEEKNNLIKDLTKVITWMEKLNELDTEKIDLLPTSKNTKSDLREDKQKLSVSKEEVLRNAPLDDGEFFKVPKVID